MREGKLEKRIKRRKEMDDMRWERSEGKKIKERGGMQSTTMNCIKSKKLIKICLYIYYFPLVM